MYCEYERAACRCDVAHGSFDSPLGASAGAEEKWTYKSLYVHLQIRKKRRGNINVNVNVSIYIAHRQNLPP